MKGLPTKRDARQALAEVRNYGSQLSEDSLWKPFVEDIEHPITREFTAIMLENAKTWLEQQSGGRSLEEMVKTGMIGDFQKYAFPLIRAIFPELISQNLVSVQPLMGPTSQVFFLDFVYGTTKGSVNRGQKIFDSLGLGTSNPYYSSPTIDVEQVGVGAAATTVYTGTLLFTPVKPASIYITDGTQVVSDDGNGGLIGDATAGSINYQTGAFSVTFAANPVVGAAITFGYDYDLEAQPNIPEVDLILTSAPVMARPRKLRTRWSIESAFNLRTLHGLEAEVELTSALGAELRWEVDREIINDIRNIVPATNLAPVWSKSKQFVDADPFAGPASGSNDIVSRNEHNLSLLLQFAKGSNLILRSTGRAVGQWIVIGMDIADILDALPNFAPTPGMPNGMIKGVFNAGTLAGRWTIYKDPFFPSNEWLMGYKGNSFLETGYIFAPYIPLYATPTIMLDDMIARKAFGTQYGRKSINPRFYARGQITA